MYAIYTHVRTYLRGSSSVHSCVCEIMHVCVCVCHGLFICLLELTYNCSPKKNTSDGIEVLPQDTTHLIQRACYQRGNPCQDPADNRTTRRSPDHRKLQFYGYVSRSSGLAKTILQGTVKGWRRQGRQRKRWGDNIREWTGLEFAKSKRAVENRGKFRKLIAKSSMVPQRPSRLRDRWWDDDNCL